MAFKIVGQDLVVDVPSEVNSDKKFSAIDYKVKVAKAPGGRLGGGKEEKISLGWTGGLSAHVVVTKTVRCVLCKHIGALVISQFN